MISTVIDLDDMITPAPLSPGSAPSSSSRLALPASVRQTRSSMQSQTTVSARNARTSAILCRVPFSQSPYRVSGLSINTLASLRNSAFEAQDHSRLTPLTASSQTTMVICTQPAAAAEVSSQPLAAKDELFLYITPLPHESSADVLTRYYNLSLRDIDTIAHHLVLNQEQRARLPRSCRPIDLLHHIQTDLTRRVHLGIDVDRPHHHAPHRRRIALNDTPIALEIHEHKPLHLKESDRRHSNGPGKHAFKKPVADLSQQVELDNEKKSATWMELFFDLTFVANITIFTHQHPIIDTATLLRYCGWFTILWWMWLSQTMFDVRFSTDDLLNRIWKLIQLFALAGFAGNGDHFTSTNSSGFAISYAVMKLVLVGQYFTVWIHAPDSRCRRPILFYMLANFLSFIMWLTSGFLIEMLSDQARYGIWFSAIGIEVITNIALAKSATVTFTGSHLPERLGLFTLVILGESIMGLFMITDDLVDAPGKLGWDNLTLLIFSITIVKCQWFLYFDDYHEQAPAPTSIHSILWTYLHFVLNLSQLLLGVGCLDLIRIHQLTRASSHFGSNGQVGYPTEDAHHAIKRSAHAGGSDLVTASEFDESGTHDLVLVYVKKYFLFVAASVFFWNAAIKYVTSRPGDKYDRAIYVSRFFMSFMVLCLLLVEHQQLNAFTLLGLEVGFCLLQVGHDLLVLYYAARKDYESQQYLSE